jgi:hypothetical protein
MKRATAKTLVLCCRNMKYDHTVIRTAIELAFGDDVRRFPAGESAQDSLTFVVFLAEMRREEARTQDSMKILEDGQFLVKDCLSSQAAMVTACYANLMVCLAQVGDKQRLPEVFQKVSSIVPTDSTGHLHKDECMIVYYFIQHDYENMLAIGKRTASLAKATGNVEYYRRSLLHTARALSMKGESLDPRVQASKELYYQQRSVICIKPQSTSRSR